MNKKETKIIKVLDERKKELLNGLELYKELSEDKQNSLRLKKSALELYKDELIRFGELFNLIKKIEKVVE